LFEKKVEEEDEDEVMEIDEGDLEDAVHYELKECLDGLKFVVSG
jgi:hypothetical protein